MHEEVCIVFIVVLDKRRRVVFVLNQPTTPQVIDAFLVTRGPDDCDDVEVDSLLDDIDRGGWTSVGDVGITAQEYGVGEVPLVFFAFDTIRGTRLIVCKWRRPELSNVHGLSNNAAGSCTQLMQIRIPELDEGLVGEPVLVDKQAVYLAQG